jgi:hypothetical protein
VAQIWDNDKKKIKIEEEEIEVETETVVDTESIKEVNARPHG